MFAANAQTVAMVKDWLGFDALSLGYVLDEPWASRILDAGINAMNVTFGGEESWEVFLRSVEEKLEAIEKSPILTLATVAADIEKAHQNGRLAVIMGTQGAHILGEEPWRVAFLERIGLRFLGIVGSFGNFLCDANSEPRDAGLTLLGCEMVDAINETSIIIDISHCGHRASREIIERGRAVVCTHANAHAVAPTDRNRKDAEITALVAKGGMIGLCGLPRSIAETSPSLKDMLDHADHIRNLVGAAHLGLGLDLMEGYRAKKITNPALIRRRTLRPDIFGTMDDFWNNELAIGFNSIAHLPDLIQGLLDRGWPAAELEGVFGRNWLRCFATLSG